MPRGKTASGAQTRASLLAHASRLFAIEGYNAVSLRAIARAAGVRAPAVLHHFPDGKAELYQTIIQEVVSRLSHHVAAAVGSADRQTLVAVAGAFWDFFAEHPDYASLILRSGFDAESPESEQFHLAGRPIAAMAIGYIGRLREEGEVAPGQLEELIFLISTWALVYHGAPALRRNIWLLTEADGSADPARARTLYLERVTRMAAQQ